MLSILLAAQVRNSLDLLEAYRFESYYKANEEHFTFSLESEQCYRMRRERVAHWIEMRLRNAREAARDASLLQWCEAGNYVDIVVPDESAVVSY